MWPNSGIIDTLSEATKLEAFRIAWDDKISVSDAIYRIFGERMADLGPSETIRAIKITREFTGMNLTEAKDLVFSKSAERMVRTIDIDALRSVVASYIP